MANPQVLITRFSVYTHLSSSPSPQYNPLRCSNTGSVEPSVSLAGLFFTKYTSEIKQVMLRRQNISHQPGIVGRGQTAGPHLNQPPHQIHGRPCSRTAGLAPKRKSVQTRATRAAIECRDVAGGCRAVEDDCYLERSIRVV